MIVILEVLWMWKKTPILSKFYLNISEVLDVVHGISQVM